VSTPARAGGLAGAADGGEAAGGIEAQPETVSEARAARPPCEVTIVAHDVGSIGGMERQLAELILGLIRLGHRVTVIAWTCRLPAQEGLSFHRVPGPRRPFLLGYLWFMIAGSLVLRRRRRGVVQATGAIVLNRVDSVAIHCCHQVYRAAPRRSTVPFRIYEGLLGMIKRGAERACVRANSTASFVCVSDGVAQEMREHYPAAAERILTIHNGVDTEAFAPGSHDSESRALRAELGIGDERLIAAFVARGWGHKGLGPVIEALAQAPDWDLVVAGEGDRRSYGELATSRGVSAAVHWLGVRGDVHVVYALADAFVLPSSYETFSLVTFEAAASGLPVLVTPVSGVLELIRDGENGFLITREPATIAARLNELARDAALRERLGRRAREAALSFSWEAMVSKHEELYARLDEQRGAPVRIS
jgi:glycosyltransferase involved in cell wall biosynthesis